MKRICMLILLQYGIPAGLIISVSYLFLSLIIEKSFKLQLLLLKYLSTDKHSYRKKTLKKRLYQIFVILLIFCAVGGLALLFYAYYMSVIIAEMTSEGLNSSITNFYNTLLESFCIDSEQDNMENGVSTRSSKPQDKLLLQKISELLKDQRDKN